MTREARLQTQLAAGHEETRRYMLLMTESIRDDVRILAEGLAHLATRVDLLASQRS